MLGAPLAPGEAMQGHRISAAMLVAVSGTLVAASCVQSPEPASETEVTSAHAPAIETKDDGDPFGGGPADDPEPTGDTGLLATCLLLAPASVPRKEDFCRSLPEEKRGGCWKYRFNRLEWAGWCYAAFSD